MNNLELCGRDDSARCLTEEDKALKRFKECGDKCTSFDEPCGQDCPDGKWHCEGQCIWHHSPCNDDCPEGRFKCGTHCQTLEEYYICNGECYYKFGPCNGECPDNRTLCGKDDVSLESGPWCLTDQEKDNYWTCKQYGEVVCRRSTDPCHTEEGPQCPEDRTLCGDEWFGVCLTEEQKEDYKECDVGTCVHKDRPC